MEEIDAKSVQRADIRGQHDISCERGCRVALIFVGQYSTRKRDSYADQSNVRNVRSGSADAGVAIAIAPATQAAAKNFVRILDMILTPPTLHTQCPALLLWAARGR